MSKTTKKSPVITMKPINETAFIKMTVANQRIAICKDVLARMGARRFKFEQGIYCHINEKDRESVDDKLTQADSLKDFLNSPEANAQNCYVCAKGALVVTWIANFNKYEKYKIHNINHNTLPELRDIFGEDILDMLENIFERQRNDRAAREAFKDALENIIENNGVLIDDGYHYGTIVK